MKKVFAVISLLLSFGLYAQQGPEIFSTETLNTQGSSFSLPIYLNADGKLSIIERSDKNLLSFNPVLHAGLSWMRINYILPIRQNQMAFSEQLANLGWVEYRSLRYEWGAGLASALTPTLSIGIAPYKGALQMTVRSKQEKKTKVPRISIPTQLGELEDWSVSDYGQFQTYGGVETYASAGVRVINLSSITWRIQNQFILRIEKISPTKIQVSIAEEGLDHRRISVGPAVINQSTSNFSGKLFSSQFVFDLGNERHQELYALAVKGKLKKVEENLPLKLQRVEWVGVENWLYFGLPMIAGKNIQNSRFSIEMSDKKIDFEITSNRNSGLLLPLRNHSKIYVADAESITLFWASEMKKTKLPAFNRNFLSIGRSLGLSSFLQAIPDTASLGATLTKLGIVFTRKEISQIAESHLSEIRFHLASKCHEEKLSCRKKKKLNKIMTEFEASTKLDWENLRKRISVLMLREPAIVYSIVKTFKLQKEAYFSFLSETYQSMEGIDSISI